MVKPSAAMQDRTARHPSAIVASFAIGSGRPVVTIPKSAPPPAPAARILNLAGEWRLALHATAPFDASGPLPPIEYDDRINLPATTETAGKGPLNPERRVAGLTPIRRINGPVWYEREFTVPDSWTGSQLALLLERTKFTAAWLDGHPLGAQPLLCTPHHYDLGPLAPGAHRLTLCVDNSRKLVPGDNHQVSEHTQGNWNGVLGRLELRATESAWIDHVAVVPDVSARSFTLRIHLSGTTGAPVAGTLTIVAESINHSGLSHRSPRLVVPLSAAAGNVITVTLPLGPDARLWDEFSPALYRLSVTLASPDSQDERTLTTGLREFTARGTQFAINGRTTFLRGEVNCCVFPLTGHPPLEVAGWLHYYRTLQEYGINHVRFHSWTPPDAAFSAADELGIYVQTELPFWGEWDDAVRHALRPEGEAILRTYGHHPSLVLLTLGNEHRGDRTAMSGLVTELRRLDPHRLYAEGANNFLATPSLSSGDDCWITARVPDPARPGRFANVRGCHATPDDADGHLQIGPGGTRHDYAAAIAGIRIPVISHEIGQFAVAPHFAEIERHTGVFAARNLEHFRAKAAAAGLLDQSDDCFRASAKLTAILYREEIEAALRTPGFGGFQLLGLQDFPGQGTALIGLLDAFLESKGAITPEEFRRFCAPQVLLARFDRHTWTAGERFTADLELAHYGATDWPAASIAWALVPKHSFGEACVQAIPQADRLQAGFSSGHQSQLRAPEDEAPLASGTLAVPAAPQGGLCSLSKLQFTLPSVTAAQHLELRLTLHAKPTSLVTTYRIWLYPSSLATRPSPPAGIVIVRHFDTTAQAALAAGHRVLLMPDAAHPFAHSPGGGFMTDFWCWPMFNNTPGTMGLLIQPEHPALASFPTSTHSDWQWYHLAHAAQPVVLDALPAALRPIVQVIDNLERVHRLGLLFEARVGPGRLLVCALDLPALAEIHPEARQFLASVLAYAASESFSPTASIATTALAAALAVRTPPSPPMTVTNHDP